MTKKPNITVYGAYWCPDCRVSKQFLGEHQIPYNWVNIEEDKEAEQLITELNNGKRVIPTITFGDGSFQVFPSNAELADRRNPHPEGWPMHEYAWKTIFLHSLVGRDQGLQSNIFGLTLQDALFQVAFPGLTPPQVVQADVASDAHQPGHEAFGIAATVQLAVDAHEDVLGQVTGLFGTPGIGVRDAANPCLIRAHEDLPGEFVTLLAALQQFRLIH